MALLLQGLAVLLGAAAFCCAVSALPSVWRGYRAGVSFWDGVSWIGAPSRLPDAARPHVRRAITRWLSAIGLFVLAAIAAALAHLLGPRGVM